MVWRIFATKLETAETMEDAGLHMRASYFYPTRTNFQQGFATTCEDSWYKGKPRLREDFGLAHEFEVAMREG
jgi:hypothetical protein